MVYREEQERLATANRLNEMYEVVERANKKGQASFKRASDCILCADIYRNQMAYNKEMEERAALDPVSHGDPGMGLGLAKDPFMQTSATMVLTGGMMSNGLVAGNTVQKLAA